MLYHRTDVGSGSGQAGEERQQGDPRLPVHQKEVAGHCVVFKPGGGGVVSAEQRFWADFLGDSHVFVDSVGGFANVIGEFFDLWDEISSKIFVFMHFLLSLGWVACDRSLIFF